MLTFILQNIHHKNFSRCYYIIAVKGNCNCKYITPSLKVPLPQAVSFFMARNKPQKVIARFHNQPPLSGEDQKIPGRQ